MFKCWIYISKENSNSLNSELHLSDKEEIYSFKSENQDFVVKSKELKILNSFFPDTRKLGLFNGFINF